MTDIPTEQEPPKKPSMDSVNKKIAAMSDEELERIINFFDKKNPDSLVAQPNAKPIDTIESLLGPPRENMPVDPHEPPQTKEPDLNTESQVIPGRTNVPPSTIGIGEYSKTQEGESYVDKMNNQAKKLKIVTGRLQQLGERWQENLSAKEGENEAFRVGEARGAVESDSQWVQALEKEGIPKATIARIWDSKEEESRKLKDEKQRLREESRGQD